MVEFTEKGERGRPGGAVVGDEGSEEEVRLLILLLVCDNHLSRVFHLVSKPLIESNYF